MRDVREHIFLSVINDYTQVHQAAAAAATVAVAVMAATAAAPTATTKAPITTTTNDSVADELYAIFVWSISFECVYGEQRSFGEDRFKIDLICVCV